jgi:hypothetical protein
VAEGFGQAGASAVATSPDVAVVTAADVPRALEAHAAAVIVVGRSGRRTLRGRQPELRRFVTLPGPLEPQVIIPVDRPRVAAYAIRTWAAGGSRHRRARNRGAAALIALGAFPDLPRSLTVGLPDHAPPFIVAAAHDLGVPRDADWFLTLGSGEPLARAVFHLFAPGHAQPRWALKFSRVAGNVAPFDREERGLRLAATAGSATAAHAPRLLGRAEVDGLPAALEQAALGERLTFLLQRPGRRTDKLRIIDAVAGWLVEVGRETASPPDSLADERRRLEREILPYWRKAGIPSDLVARVPAVPGVLQHNDPGSWNLLVNDGAFIAVDWESARAPGLPLWDLLYFLVDSLVHLDRAEHATAREAYAARLLRGDAPSSRILFHWLRTAVRALGIPDDAVGPIATLGWLHHGFWPASRAAVSGTLTPKGSQAETFGDWMVRVWLTTPGLGAAWRPVL